MDRPGVCQVAEGSGEQRKVEETGCEIIEEGGGGPRTLAVKRLVAVVDVMVTPQRLSKLRQHVLL